MGRLAPLDSSRISTAGDGHSKLSMRKSVVVIFAVKGELSHGIVAPLPLRGAGSDLEGEEDSQPIGYGLDRPARSRERHKETR